MALPHKIFTWPSIMDCDLIEAECSHSVPSVNSPHRSFFPFFSEKLYPAFFFFLIPRVNWCRILRISCLLLKLLGRFCFLLLFLANICKHVVNFTNSSRLFKSTVVFFFFNVFSECECRVLEETKHRMLTAISCNSSSFSPSYLSPPTMTWRNFAFKLYSLLNWWAKSQSEPQSVNPCVAVVAR